MAKGVGALCTFAVSLSCVAPLARPVQAALPTVIGTFVQGLTGDGRHFDSQGDLGCLVTKRGRGPELFVLGLQDPVNPTVLGTLDVPGHLNRVVLRGDIAYVATSLNDQELLIVDVSDPASPQVMGVYDAQSSNDAISLAVAGSILFLGTERTVSPDRHELHIIDVSNPAAPVLLDSVHLGADVHDLALEGDLLYAATGGNDRELVVFDVSVPEEVFELSSVDLPGSADAKGVDVHRGSIYLVRRDRDANFVVVDANGLNQISSRSLDGRGEKVRVYRDRAYVATDGGRTGLQILDIGDPSHPRVVRSISHASATAVHVDGPHAYLTSRRSRDGLRIVDTQSLLRPNVVIVYTDDLHPRTVDFMPQLEELASRGVTFRQSFVTTPVCGPSRASLLTGLYAHNHGAVPDRYIGDAAGSIGSDQSTLATWLQSAGYRTGFFGKYVNGFNHNCVAGSCDVPPGWEDWQAHAQGAVGHLYYDYGISNNGTLEFFGNEPEDYSTDVLTQKTLEFVEREDNRPFFAILSVHAPHLDDFVVVPAAPRHTGAFDGVTPWRPPSYDEGDLSDKPSVYADQPHAADPFSVFPSRGGWLDFHRQQQLEALLSVDEAIGEVLETLERLGEDEDTVVIYTADNGYFWGEHRLWGGKAAPYEESIRVPLVVSYPRLIEPGGENATNMVLNIDFAPSIAELAGAVPDGPVDGQSILPLLKGEPVAEWRTDFLIEQYAGARIYQGLRHTSGTYAYYLNLGEEELYDHLVDVDQMESQAYNPTYDSIRLYCQDRIQQLMTNDALRVEF